MDYRGDNIILAHTHTHRKTVWISAKTIMCDKLIELLFKRNEHSTREGWMGGLCLPGFKEGFR